MTLKISFIPLAAICLCLLLGSADALPRRGMMLATQVDAGNLGATQQVVQRDINAIADAGGNIVRLPVYFAWQPSTNWWIGLADAAFATCHARGVNLVIDFHWPGNQPNSTITDESDFVRKWERFASHFAGKPRDRINIWYDLCNEPNGRNPSGWPAVALKAAQTIRRYDTQSRIVYAYQGVTIPGTISSSFRPLTGISNQIVEFHFYNWNALQFDLTGSAVRYPDVVRGFTKAKMQEILVKVRDFGNRYGVPVYVGETAIFRGHLDAPAFLTDFTSVCDEMGVHLTLHAFRESAEWNYELNPNAWSVITNWLRRR